MCCLIAIVLLISPRAGLIIWWIFESSRFSAAFSTILWPILGIIFAPWTTLAYLLIFRGGVDGLDWLVLAIGILADLSAYSGGARGGSRRRR